MAVMTVCQIGGSLPRSWSLFFLANIELIIAPTAKRMALQWIGYIGACILLVTKRRAGLLMFRWRTILEGVNGLLGVAFNLALRPLST
jgi:hypothetical protein